MHDDSPESTSTTDGILRRPEVDPDFLKGATLGRPVPLLVCAAARSRAATPPGGATPLGVRSRDRPGDLSGSPQPVLEHQPGPLGHDPACLGVAGDRLHGRLQHGPTHRDGRPVDGGPVDPVVRCARRPPDQMDDGEPGPESRHRGRGCVLPQRSVDRLHARHGCRHVRAGVPRGADLLLDLQPVPRRRRRRSVPGELQPAGERSVRGAVAGAADQARPRG